MVDSEKFLDIWPIIKPKFLKAGRVSCFDVFCCCCHGGCLYGETQLSINVLMC